MDLDPMKRRLVTRCIGIFDMFLGTSVLVVNLHTMWDYYLHEVKLTSQVIIDNVVYNLTNNENDDGKIDKVSEQLVHLKLPFYSFVMICLVVFGVNLLQIFMGFALLVATFGRNQGASINIAVCWIRSSVTLLFLVSLKVIVLGTGILCGELDAEWMTLGITIFEIIFRIFSTFWVPKFIIYLKCQSDFDFRCHVMRY